jgi:hypothetical protein
MLVVVNNIIYFLMNLATTLPKVDDDRMSKKQQLQKLDDEHDAFKLIEDVTISDEVRCY